MAVNRLMPRVQKVVLPILRTELADDYPTLNTGSWVKDVDLRTYPVLNIRRLSGLAVDVARLDRPVIELTAYGDKDMGLTGTENLYLDARQVLWDAVERQTVVSGVGYLHSFFEVMGPTQFDSPYDGTWRIQGLIQLGLRPVRST
jgi:hypothetical protein